MRHDVFYHVASLGVSNLYFNSHSSSWFVHFFVKFFVIVVAFLIIAFRSPIFLVH